MDRVVQSPVVGSHHEVYLFCDLSVLVGVAISLNDTHSKYFAIRTEIKETRGNIAIIVGIY